MGIRKNNQGFSSIEFLTVIVLATVMIGIVLGIASHIAFEEQFKVMRYDAKLFSFNQGAYSLSSNDEVIYLKTLIEHGLSSQIQNPFGGSEKYCDIYESKIVRTEEKKFITFKCGDYLIDEEYDGDANFTIYRVSNWQTEPLKGSLHQSVESMTGYNYQEDGKEVFESYYPEDLFLFLYNARSQTTYLDLDTLGTVISIEKKEFYRTRKIVSEVKG